MSFNSSDHIKIEQEVSSNLLSYRNLLPDALYTSREDFEAIFSSSHICGTFVDLGCGVGLGCLQYAYRFPDRQATGVDIEEARINHGLKIMNEMNLKNVELKICDLLESSLPLGDTYFLYFPTGHVLDKVLSDLYDKKEIFTLIAIESHGDLLPRLELESWLKLVEEIPLSSQRHYPFARIYRSSKEERQILKAYQISYQNFVLWIEDETGVWLGDSFGLQCEQGERFTLMFPPRTIQWKSVKNLKTFQDIEETHQQLVTLRRTGPVMIETILKIYEGFIRKIYVSPVFTLELSTGEQVEWSHITKIITRT